MTVLVEAVVRTDATDKLEALCLRKEVARDTVEASERIRFAAGSASVERESVAPDLGLFGLPAGDGGGVPKRLSNSLWNLRLVVANASGILISLILLC